MSDTREAVCECGHAAHKHYLLTGECLDCERCASFLASSVPSREAGPGTPPRVDSGNYGELPDSIRPMINGYEWDNMLRDEQRQWLIDRLDAAMGLVAKYAEHQAELAALRSSLQEARAALASINARRLEVLANRIDRLCDSSHPVDEKHLRGDAGYLRTLAQPGRAAPLVEPESTSSKENKQ
jgi:hypothetical protein